MTDLRFGAGSRGWGLKGKEDASGEVDGELGGNLVEKKWRDKAGDENIEQWDDEKRGKNQAETLAEIWAGHCSFSYRIPTAYHAEDEWELGRRRGRGSEEGEGGSGPGSWRGSGPLAFDNEK